MAKGLGQDQKYWEALEDGRLELPKCTKCGHWQWPAPYRCEKCGSWEFDWVEQPFEGTMFSWTRTPHPFDGAEQLGSPYTSVLVEIPTGGNIRLLGLMAPGEQPVIGQKVQGKRITSHVYGRDIPAIQWSIQDTGAAA